MSEPAPAPPVLIVEDDADMRRALDQFLTLTGHAVIACVDAAAALARLPRDFAGVVLSDVRMPGMDGLELLDLVHARDPELPVILLTGHGDVPMAVAALKAGAWDFLTKPFDPDALAAAIARATGTRRLVIENRALRRAAEQAAAASPILGRSAIAQGLRDRIAALANAPIDIIIEGESGTGKELAARTLHQLSPGKGRFVSLPCAATSERMAEETVFAARGPIANADDGTLFVDDLHRAGPLLQSRLADFAERRMIGTGDAAQPIACRIVATVPDAARLEQVDDALRYRLSGVRLYVAPLRDRRGDIPLLLAHFVAAAARGFGREAVVPDRAALDRAAAQDWPGNIRELEHHAERIVLGLDHGADGAADTTSLPDRVDAFERAELAAALAATDGNVSAAIARLGIPRKTFYYKARRLGLDPATFRSG